MNVCPEVESRRGRWRAEAGQATAEYALVMVAAATLAGVLIAWAAGGGGVGRVMSAVVDLLVAKVS